MRVFGAEKPPLAPQGRPSGRFRTNGPLSRQVQLGNHHVQGLQRPIAEGAACSDRPEKKLKCKTASAHRMRNATPKIMLYSEVP